MKTKIYCLFASSPTETAMLEGLFETREHAEEVKQLMQKDDDYFAYFVTGMFVQQKQHKDT